MSNNIQRGSSCRLKFKILGNVDIEALGEPTVAIAQDLAYVTPEDDQITVDIPNRCVYVDLEEYDTMALAENTHTRCQLAFSDELTGTVYRFPVHELYVSGTLMDSIF